MNGLLQPLIFGPSTWDFPFFAEFPHPFFSRGGYNFLIQLFVMLEHLHSLYRRIGAVQYPWDVQ
jgi:hypothetical protein